ncbi:restriction endonuclease [Candidatus Pacearchaeota archaeon]|nr:restriction endonuclease [Candidatus Pacearchaeota archaeon]
MEKYSPKTEDKYKKIVYGYIKNNPNASYRDIKNATRIKIERLFEHGMRQAYLEAGVSFSKPLQKRNRKEMIKEVIQYIQKNPKSTITEIQNNTRVTIPKIFKTIHNAYKLAEIPYPQRKRYTGSENAEIRKRAADFEDEAINLLSTRGKLIKHYRTKYGIADALLDMEDKKIIIEVKDYQKKNITFHELKQLYRYILGTEHCCDGILVTNKNKWKKGKVYIENNRISVISLDQIIHGAVV